MFYRGNQYPSLEKYRQATIKKASLSSVFLGKDTCERDSTKQVLPSADIYIAIIFQYLAEYLQSILKMQVS